MRCSLCIFSNTMSDRRVVRSKFEEEISTYGCEVWPQKFNTLSCLSRHQREEHGPKVYCKHCGVDFPQARTFALRKHENRCSQETYRPRGRIRQQQHQQLRSRSPRAPFRVSTFSRHRSQSRSRTRPLIQRQREWHRDDRHHKTSQPHQVTHHKTSPRKESVPQKQKISAPEVT